MQRKIGRFFVRLALLILLTAGLIAMPDIGNDGVLHLKNAVVCLFAVVLTGKLLYDTFFAERFRS